MSSTAMPAKSTSKGAKKSKVITLRLSSELLARFPSDTKPTSPSPPTIEPSPSDPPPDHAEKSSESNSTPLPSNANDETDANSLAPPKADGKKRRSGGGTVTGRKRAPPAIDPNAPPRERARPGPKKKPRLPDGTIDRSHDEGGSGAGIKKAGPAAAGGTNAVSTHKLGPKANTGAINAGLRALDRSGKPCRRWERKPMQLKSFTGAIWGMPSWKAPLRDSFSGDVKSDSTGSSDMKPGGSSALPSERSNIDVEMANGIESSPAPQVAA